MQWKCDFVPLSLLYAVHLKEWWICKDEQYWWEDFGTTTGLMAGLPPQDACGANGNLHD
jgi:hypothetical protein